MLSLDRLICDSSKMFVNELFTSHVSFKHVSYLVLINVSYYADLHKFLKRKLQWSITNYELTMSGAWNLRSFFAGLV